MDLSGARIARSGLLLAGLLLSSCSGSAEPVDEGVQTGSTAAEVDCRVAIPTSATDVLGWDLDADEPELNAGRCILDADEAGNIAVASRSVPDAGDEGAARDALAEVCSTFDGSDPAVEEPVPWLEAGYTGCALLPESGVGLAELFAVTNDDRLLQIRVASLQPVDVASLREGINQLLIATDEAYP